MAKARKKSSSMHRPEIQAEFETICREMLVELHEPITRVFRKIIRSKSKTNESLYFVIWEWFGKNGPGITIGFEDSGPPFQGDFTDFDAIDWKNWSRRLGKDSWDFFQEIVIQVFGKWWSSVGGVDYPRRAVIGNHDLNDWVDLLTGKPARI